MLFIPITNAANEKRESLGFTINHPIKNIIKKKRRKGYKKRNGHRQSLTQIVIEGINGSAPKKKAAKKAEATEE